MRFRYVYIIGVGDSPVKVGVANDVKTRLASLQVGCPDRLILHYQIRLPFEDAETVEKLAHKALSHRHRHLEWFDISASDARDAVMEIGKRVVGEQSLLRRENDAVLVSLRGKYPELEDLANEAVSYYRTCMLEPTDVSRLAVARMNNAIIQGVGATSFNLFKTVIVGGKPLIFLTGYNVRLMHNAEVGLVNALNALAGYYFGRKQKVLLDRIPRNAA